MSKATPLAIGAPMDEVQRPNAEPPSEFRKSWDTAHIKKQDRFSYFREGVCQAFLSLSPERPKDSDIEARIDTAELPRGIISRVEATPHRISRTKADIGALPSECLSLVLQSSGILHANIGGRECTHRSGDLGLMETAKVSTFDIVPGARYSATALIFDKTLLLGHSPPDDFHQLGSNYRKAIKSCLYLIDEKYKTATANELSSLFDACISLLISGSINQRGFLEDRCTNESTVRLGILRSIKHFIVENIADRSCRR